MVPENDHDRAKRVAARTAIELGTTGLGYLVGGPTGALVAAGIKPSLELIAERERRGHRNIEQVVNSVTEATGLSPEEFAAWADSSDGRFVLTTDALQAAYGTLYEEKVTALATVLTENVDDDARLDTSVLIVAALADLEAMHVRVLRSIIRGDLPPPRDREDLRPGSVLESQLDERFPNLGPGILPIMAALERHSLVRRGPLGETREKGVWRTMPFGYHLLRYLGEASVLP